MLVHTPMYCTTHFFAPQVAPRSLTWSDMHQPSPLPSTWSNMSTDRTRSPVLSDLSHICRDHPAQTTQNRLLYLIMLPSFTIINPLLCPHTPPLAATSVSAAFLAWHHRRCASFHTPTGWSEAENEREERGSLEGSERGDSKEINR